MTRSELVVLKSPAFGSPTDEQPVFEAIVESASRLCDASFSGVFLAETGQLTLAAVRGVRSAAWIRHRR